MFILPKEEFVEELKAEMAGYEEITEAYMKDWFNKFEAYLSDKKVKDKRISRKGDSVSIKLQDESELFAIADKFFAAISNEDLERYWSDWSL
jgi:hypothetical protein